MATIPRGCCSHCKYKDCEMKMQYLALEKENMRLRDEIDKTNAQIGCRVLKLSDYCYMKEKLKYDIDETKKRLQKTVKQKDSILRQKNRILREKDNAIQKKLKELESLNAKCLRHNAFCTSLQEANLKINNLEEEKNLLTSELDNMTKEQNKWCNSAKERAQVIAEFLKANMQIVDYNSWKATMSLSEELQAVKGSLDDNTADLMFLKQSLQTTSEACQNCQTSFLEQKTLLEEKILQLENQIVNDSFLQNQQSEMIKKLTQKNEDYKKRGVKRIKKELLSPTGDMNLPPTPSTPDQDMYQNNEFEDEESSKLKQNSQTANCPQTMLCSNSPKENASNSIETGDIKVSPSSPMNPVVLRVNTKEVTMSDEDISVLSPRPVEIFETQKQVSRVSSRGETVDSKTKCSVELDQTILFNKRKNSTEEKVYDSSEKTDSYGIKALQSFKKPVLPVDEEMCDEDHPISSPSPVKMPGTQKAHSMVSPEIGALNNKTKLSVKSDEIGLEESTQASSNDQVINNKIQSPEYLEIIDILSEVTQIPSILSPIRPLKVKCDKRPIELNLQTDYPKRRKTLFSPTHSSNLSEFPVLCDLRKDLVDLSPEPVETFIEVKPKNSCGEENKSPKPSVIKKERKPGSDSHTASEIEATPKPSVIIKERKPGSDSHTASEIEAAPKPSVIKKERRPGSDSHTASEIEAAPKPSVIRKERKPGRDSHTASEIEAAPKPSVIKKERKPSSDSHTASEIEAVKKECYVVLEDINHISEKNEKSPCLNQTSQGLKFVDKQMSKLTPNTPDTITEEFKNPNTLQASERLQREDLNSCPVQSLAKSLSTSKDKPSSAKDIVHKQHNIEAEKEVKPSEKLLQEIKKSNSLSTREAKSRIHKVNASK
ncbi:uncharacterized protein LOC129002944 [Macrosteles quadrilineatus]|uniref:uncharacterized protein LOC129002944 n=1 Tax=Macrosteles quadrilineatus TaxID=74068 RepID=UPI0023E1F64D|nr:uncharacterized protein LOC129002944 [Macrosteles quadrilineatus]